MPSINETTPLDDVVSPPAADASAAAAASVPIADAKADAGAPASQKESVSASATPDADAGAPPPLPSDDDGDAALAKAMRAGLDNLSKRQAPQDDAADQKKATAAQPTPGTAAVATPGAAGDPPPAADAEFANVPFRDDPLFKQVVSDRDQARQGAAEFARIQQFVTGAGLAPEMVNVGFAGMAAMREAGMNAQEMHEAFQVIKALRENPAAGLRMLEPHLKEASERVSKEMPADIQALVDSGEISEEAATELQALRAFKAQAITGQQHQAQAMQAQQEAAAIQQTVQSWAADWMARDPDAKTAHKQQLVLQGVTNQLFMFAQQNPGRRPTPQQVIEMCKGVVTSVEGNIKAIVGAGRPAPTARPQPGFGSNGGVVVQDPGAKAKTFEEALLQGYRRAV